MLQTGGNVKLGMSDHSNVPAPELVRKCNGLEDILLTSGLQGFYGELNTNYWDWKETKINIAVVGRSGAGKSTFINNFLHLEENGEEEAATGVIEMTKIPKSYRSKHCLNVIFWDLPGIGSPSFNKQSYINDTSLGRYDYFLILSRKRFTTYDAWLAEYVKDSGRKFYFVRTHIEEDLDNDKDSHPRTHIPEKVIADIRKYCEESLAKQGLEGQNVFLVDNFDPDKHDFFLLTEKMLDDAGEFKACILASCIASTTTRVIELKTKVLKKRIKNTAQRCGLLYHKNTKVAMNVFNSECELYRKVFEIDESNIRVDKNIFQLPESDIIKKVKYLDGIDLWTKLGLHIVLMLMHIILKREHDDQVIELVDDQVIELVLNDYLERLRVMAIELYANMSTEVSRNVHEVSR